LAGQEQQNAQLGQQIAAELKQADDEAARQPLVPPALAEQAHNVQQLFEQKAAQPLQDLAAQMNQGKEPNRPAPDLRRMQTKADRLQKELEAMKDRLQAVAQAQKGVHKRENEALVKLQKQMLQQDARLTERDLGDLRDFMQKLREGLRQLANNEQHLLNENETGGKSLPKLEKDQIGLEKQADRPLRQTQELQASDKMKNLRRELEESGERSQAAQGQQASQEEESPYRPALGGPMPKCDPRFAPKQSSGEHNAGSRNAEQQGRADLSKRQRQEGQKLSAAEQSLASDQQSLERMLERLNQAAHAQAGQQQGAGEAGQSPTSGQPSGSEGLEQLLRSADLQRANAMASRMRQLGSGRTTAQGQGQSPNQNSESALGSLQGGPRAGMQLDPALAKLDPETRSLILKMQPKLRDQLLQGMREEGPEGYRQFIEDYFKRLSREKSPR
jgi:hypothetical protein